MDPWVAMMSAPKPLLAPTNSPTTAPTKASTTATRMPAQIPGKQAGIFKRHRVWLRLAPSMRNNSKRCASTCAKPVMVFSSKGKKQIKAVITTVGVVPKPNHTINKGTNASLGTTWLVTT